MRYGGILVRVLSDYDKSYILPISREKYIILGLFSAIVCLSLIWGGLENINSIDLAFQGLSWREVAPATLIAIVGMLGRIQSKKYGYYGTHLLSIVGIVVFINKLTLNTDALLLNTRVPLFFSFGLFVLSEREHRRQLYAISLPETYQADDIIIHRKEDVVVKIPSEERTDQQLQEFNAVNAMVIAGGLTLLAVTIMTVWALFREGML